MHAAPLAQAPPPAPPHHPTPRSVVGGHAPAHPPQPLHPVPNDAAARKAAKAKDLSHVPCKFFKANSCTAGDACPFSHDAPTPGTSKPICQWFAKGNCKFGHKCALAHVLPGQPMSFDRKNKRAAQQALREAQANADGSGLVTTTHATAQSPRMGDGSGLVQTLRQSVDLGTGNARLNDYALYQQMAAMGLQQAGHIPSDIDAMFGSPDSVGHGMSTSSPSMQNRSLQPQHDSAAHVPLNFTTLSNGPTATFVAPTSSGLSHHFGSPSSNGRSSVAAHAMLSEQARRLSSTSESLSPPRRMAPMSRARMSFNSGSPSGNLATSPPLAVPGAGAGAGATSIFGTSPFSGSRGLFMPSSYDSNEDTGSVGGGGGGFPRSPPVRPSMLGGDASQRSGSGLTLGVPWSDAFDDEYEDGDEANADALEEGFLPSSLIDLLTPEELQRRTLRANGASGRPGSGHLPASSPSAFDPFMSSKSVPAELLLAAGKPPHFVPFASPTSPPSLGERSASASAAPSVGLLSSSIEGRNPSAVPYQPVSTPYSGGGSLLSQSRTREATVVPGATTGPASVTATPPTSSLLGAALNGHPSVPAAAAAGIYSASYSEAVPVHRPPSFAAAVAAGSGHGTASGGAGPGRDIHPPQPQAHSLFQPPPPRYPQSGLSPGTNASLALPGSSLPGGLAAGLSRLHLVPPSHTGETPPSSSYAAAAAAAAPPSGGRPGSGTALVGSPLARDPVPRVLGVSPSFGGAAVGSGPGAGPPGGTRLRNGPGTSGTGTPEPQSAVTERPPARIGGDRELGRVPGPGSADGSGSAEEDGGLEGTDHDGEADAEASDEIQFDMEVA